MKNILLVLLLISSINHYSQNQFNSSDMSVTRTDLELNTYTEDSTANALVLHEYGKSYIDKNTYKLKTEVTKKLKILNRDGFDKATQTIYLYNNDTQKEKISNISATTYNLENNSVTKTRLEKSQIFVEKYNDKNTLIKFSFPNIKEGSVVTFNYTMETPFIFKYRTWYFQSDIPTLYSHYDTSIPGNYEYNIKLVGYLKLHTNDSKIVSNCLEGRGGTSAHCVNITYIIKDIPAFIEEDHMTTKNNYLSRIEYELKTFRGFDGTVNHYTKTWKTVDTDLKTDKNIGRQLNKSGAVKDLLDESIVNETDPLEKAKSIFRFVQNTYAWNNRYNIFNDISIKDLIDNKSGNVSEINILLHNLLEENDIEVLPVLLSTRNNGFTTKIYPVLTDFNYLIVQATINGETYLLDATDDYLAFGQLPFRCLNQDGRLLDFKNGSSWIDIKADQTSFIQYRCDLNLNSDAIISGNVTRKSSGYHALPYKRSYFEKKDNHIKLFKDKYPLFELSEFKSETEDKTDFEFSENFLMTYDTGAVGDMIYLNPLLFKFFSENFFKLQQRTYPIDFGYEDSYAYMIKIQIDDSFEIVEQPQDMAFKLPNNKGSIVFSSTLENNSLMLYFKLSFNESYYNPEYYPSLKEFVSTAVDIQKNSLLVLKKK